MSVRFTMLSNDDLKFGDASGAIASRFLILIFTRSFFGNEDPGIFNRLLPELPAILNWSLDGLDRLRERGWFVSPKSSGNAIEQMRDLTSSAFGFVRDVCVLTEESGKPHSELFDTVYAQWVTWCEQNHRKPGNKASFSSMMSSAYPAVSTERPYAPDPDNPGEKKKGPRTYQGLAISQQWIADRAREAARRVRGQRQNAQGVADHG